MLFKDGEVAERFHGLPPSEDWGRSRVARNKRSLN